MLNKPPPTAMQGERAFYNRIEYFFEENNNVFSYFEPDIGGLRPDFILLSPKFGVIIVEIKDYSPDNLINIHKSGKWEKLGDGKQVLITNPFDQIYQYWRAIKNLVNHSHFPDEVKIPILNIIGFNQISSESERADAIRELTPSRILVCFKETLGRNKNFEEFLNDILPIDFNLKTEYFQVLRANIIPTCRLPSLKQVNLNDCFTVEDKITLLDLEQEKLATKLGEGHRLYLVLQEAEKLFF